MLLYCYYEDITVSWDAISLSSDTVVLCMTALAQDNVSEK